MDRTHAFHAAAAAAAAADVSGAQKNRSSDSPLPKRPFRVQLDIVNRRLDLIRHRPSHGEITARALAIIATDVTALASLVVVVVDGEGKGDGDDDAHRHARIVVEHIRTRLKEAMDAFASELEKRERLIEKTRLRHAMYSAAPWTPPPSGDGHPPVRHWQQQPRDQVGSVAVVPTDARMQAVKAIEHSIVDIGVLYARLTAAVADADAVVMRIDDDLADTCHHAARSADELTRLVSSSRRPSSDVWLALKVLAIMTVFAVIVL